MKGVILAGGTGTRLHPMTRITNKHLLPIYDRPMIYYPIQTLVNAGIEDIMVVTGGNHAGEFLRLLGNGREFGLKRLSYSYQERAGGIAEALGLAQHSSLTTSSSSCSATTSSKSPSPPTSRISSDRRAGRGCC